MVIGGGMKGRPSGQIWKFILRNAVIQKYHLRFAPHITAGEE